MVPNFIRNFTANCDGLFMNNNLLKSRLNQILNKFHFKLLNLLISEKCFNINKNSKTLKYLENKIISNIPEVANNFLALQSNYKSSYFKYLKLSSIKKFNNLKSKYFEKHNFNTKPNGDWIINLTDIKIPSEVSWMLSLGKKFAIPLNNNEFPLFKLIAETEFILKSAANDKIREEKRSLIANVLNKVKNSKLSKCPIEKEILHISKITKRFLSQNKQLIVVSADKGNKTVVMLKSDYCDKMKKHFENSLVYKPLRYDTTYILENRLISLSKNLFHKNFITEDCYKRITMHDTSIPKAYGLPKIHKDGVPVRIIVASYDSPAYEISAFFAGILKKLTANSKYNVNNSFEFIQKIAKLKLDPGEFLTSYDVESLFTNVSIDFALETIEERWHEVELHTPIPKREFFEILNFILRDCNQFMYDGKIYKQEVGTPMGLPLSPVLCDISMEKILDLAVSKLNFVPKIFVKYVDDIFTVVPNSLSEHTINTLNSINSGIRFTTESEHNGKLSYLDVMLSKEKSGKLTTEWYSKPSSSNRLLNYFSSHPFIHKMNVVDNLINRVLKLSSNSFSRKNISLIKTILISNGYPSQLIEKRIQRHIYKRDKIASENSKGDEPLSMVPKVFKGLCYVPSVSESIGQMLCDNTPDLIVGFRPFKVNRIHFSFLKDRITKDDTRNVVYKIPCLGNGFSKVRCNLSYIGHTGNKLITRMGQHLEDIISFNQDPNVNKDKGQTALVRHFEDGHAPDFDNVSILMIEPNYSKRTVLESLNILTNDTMNFRLDTNDISKFYHSLLNIRNRNEPQSSSNI